MANRFTPISANSDLSQIVAQINRNFQALDAQTYTDIKSMSGSGKVVNGKFPDGKGYGLLLADSSGKNRIVVMIRKDGSPWIAMTKDGIDVLEAGGQ
jgi:hypothetical protein